MLLLDSINSSDRPQRNRNLTLETAVIRLQKIQALPTLPLICSDPLHTLNDCKKCIGTTVRKRTQWKPAVFAVKRFAVHVTSLNDK